MDWMNYQYAGGSENFVEASAQNESWFADYNYSTQADVVNMAVEPSPVALQTASNSSWLQDLLSGANAVAQTVTAGAKALGTVAGAVKNADNVFSNTAGTNQPHSPPPVPQPQKFNPLMLGLAVSVGVLLLKTFVLKK